MDNMPILLFFIYSAFTVNLLLQCGLGIKGTVEAKAVLEPQSSQSKIGEDSPLGLSALVKIGVIFLTVIILWLVFSKVVYSILPGIYIYVLLFPVSYIAYHANEHLVFYNILKKEINSESSVNFPGGITAVAVFLCVYLANNFLETIILSFGFSSGILAVKLIIREIRKRAALEAVPVFLRGKPLVLITMGMLSLVFTTASLLIFRMIGIR